MYSEFDDISYIDMSNSELFILEKDLDSIEFQLLLRSKLEFTDENRIATSEDGQVDQEKQCEEKKQYEEKKDNKTERKMATLGGFQVGEDDDDNGFRTPTSLDHKIPVIQQCPPAPKKPKCRPSSTKRKLSSNIHPIHIAHSDVIELLFPAVMSDLDRKIKKVRAANPM